MIVPGSCSPDSWPDTAPSPEAYTLDLRHVTAGCRIRSLSALSVNRA